MWLLMNDLGLKARLAFSKFMCDEEGDVNIVSIVVLIGIAVLLAVFFKGQIMDLLETLFGTIKDKANSAVSGEYQTIRKRFGYISFDIYPK